MLPALVVGLGGMMRFFAFFICLTMPLLNGAFVQAQSGPKMRVGVAPAEDRWLTLGDGMRVYQGLEISYLLGQKLFDSQKYSPVLLTDDTSLQHPLVGLVVKQGGSPRVFRAGVATTTSPISEERWNQIPQGWMDWTSSTPEGRPSVSASAARSYSSSAIQPYVDLTITPIVETLIYTSGQRSDRVVYGFSPDHLNPFNEGRAGSLDNEYIASVAQELACVKPDFFNGGLDPAGSGPFAGNFGADLDEGVVFNLFGYGFGFKKKHFDIVSQIRFLVDDHRTGKQDQFVFQTKGSGDDTYVSGSYTGFNLAIEIQKRKTLLDGLKVILPQVVDNLLTQRLGDVWESSILSISPQIVLGAGVDEGVQPGLQLKSPFGAVYKVIQVGGTTSILQKVGGITRPFVGEPLRVFTGQEIVWQGSLAKPATHLVAKRALDATKVQTSASGNTEVQEKVFQTVMTIPMKKSERAVVQQEEAKQCFGKTTGWVEDTIDAAFILYAWWKYDNILDQAPHQDLPTKSSGPKIALIDSGVDYNDDAIKDHFVGTAARQVLGFDFISWDPRPSDDLGHGTAAAKYLATLTKQDFVIVPLKVIGSHGEIHSAAVYDAFDFAINNHVDAILVPWSSIDGTKAAYKMGATKAAQAGIPVFVASNSINSEKNIFVPPLSNHSYESGGLGGASIRLGPDGVAAVDMLAQWLADRSLGGPNAKLH